MKNLNLILLVAMLFVSPLLAVPLTDNGDGTVTDSATGLVWQKCTSGLVGSSCGAGSVVSYYFPNALQYCNSLTLGSRSWRLPSMKELLSVLNYKYYGPTIDPSFFPGTSTTYYMSSTSKPTDGSMVWSINFNDGYTTYRGKVFSGLVRCVSGP